MVLENQLFAPPLKGVIDFQAPGLSTDPDPVLRSPWGRGKRRTGSKQNQSESKSDKVKNII